LKIISELPQINKNIQSEVLTIHHIVRIKIEIDSKPVTLVCGLI